MFDLQVTQTAMELLPLVCVSLLTWSGTTFAAENEPKVITVEEGSDVTLPCSLSSKQSISSEMFEWKKDDQKQVFLYNGGIHSNNDLGGQDVQFRGRVSHFPDKLKSGDASITIRNTKVTDSGNYTCEFPDIQPSQMFHMKLVVGGILKDRTGENIPGAAPEPSITILDETKDGVLLQCAVRGVYPKPEVEWQDSEGKIIPAEDPQVSERGGRFDVILRTTVNKASRFRCVATQKEISHTIHAETYVPFKEKPAEVKPGFPIGWVVGSVLCTLSVVGVLVIIVLFVLKKKGYTILERKKDGDADYKTSLQEEA